MASGNVTVTTAANFIPEVWTEPIDDFAKAAKRLISRVRDVSELVPAGTKIGDTIHIPRISEESTQTVTADTALSYKTFTDPKTDLSIDQHKAVPKRLEDIALIQANVDLLIPYAESMAYAWMKTAETFVADLLQTVSAHDITLSSDNQVTSAELLEGEQNLLDEDYQVDMIREAGQLWVYSSPAVRQFMKGLAIFTDYDKTGQPGTGYTGAFDKVYGIPIISSTDWDSAGTTGEEGATLFARNGLLFAMQQNMTIEYARGTAAGFLADIIVVSGIYGAALAYGAADSTQPTVNFNNP